MLKFFKDILWLQGYLKIFLVIPDTLLTAYPSRILKVGERDVRWRDVQKFYKMILGFET